MLRDMKQNKTQFISIFIMIVMAVFIYSGISSEWFGLFNIVNKYYEETNLADAWIYSTGFDKEAAGKVAEIDGVTGVERRLTLKSVANLGNSPVVDLHFVEDYKISTFKLLEGEAFSPDKEGIWLDSLFAKAQGLKVGDKVKYSFYGYTLEKEIKGLIISPEYVYSAADGEIIPERKNHGYGFLSYKEFPKELPFAYTEMMITVDKASEINLEDEIDKALDSKYSVFLARENLRSYMQFSEEIKEHRAIGKIFPIAFLAVALLTTVTTMARLVNNQRTQIGILKAMGFKRRRILFHYVSYGLWLSLAGTIIGAVLGVLTLPYLFYGPMQTTFTLPEWYSKMPVSVFIMAVLSVLGCTLITFLTCGNVLKDTPSETLRPKAPKSVKHSVLELLRIWKHLGFQTQWNIRDIIRCKGRSIMAIVGITGCSALLICGFSMQDSLDYVVDWDFKVQNLYESRVELEKDITSEQVKAIVDQYGGEELLEGSVEIKANGIKKSGELTVTNDNKLLRHIDAEARQITLPKDRVSISYKMAELLEIETGDTIQWHIYGEEGWKTAKIGAIYRTPIAQGITMPKKLYEGYGYSFIPTAILSDKDLTKEIPADTEGIAKTQTKQYMIDSYNKMSETMDLMVYILILAASLLAIVVIYNLGVLSFTERQRELSTLKVIGFKTKKLRTLLLMQNIWLTIIGIIPGIPIGLWIVRYIFQFVGNVFDFIIIANFTSYLYAIAGTMLISILVNRFFSKRLKKIDMVTSLKAIE
jgi:putative ABC transport system permease protein